MIVLLDANALVQNPWLDSVSWKIILGQAEPWGIELRVPQVSLLEATGRLRRRYRDDAAAVEELAKERRSRALRRAADDLRERAEQLVQEVTDAIAAAGATLIDPVPVPHLELVRRQVERRKPCKKDGNGYRDTLNWLTILETARANPDRRIVWVSDDGDFCGDGKEGKRSFHPDLLREAEAAGVVDRINLYPSEVRLALDLLAENGIHGDLSQGRLELCTKTISQYVIDTVLPAFLDSVGSALERRGAVVRFDHTKVTVEEQGRVDRGTVWTFTATIDLLVPEPADEPQAIQAPRPVQVSGLVTTDERDRITDHEISAIDAPHGWAFTMGIDSDALRDAGFMIAAVTGHLNASVDMEDIAHTLSIFKKALEGVRAYNEMTMPWRDLVQQVAMMRRQQLLENPDSPAMQKYLRQMWQTRPDSGDDGEQDRRGDRHEQGHGEAEQDGD
ncbi:PIN domain-containing protein [Thermomonospora cellulosilytica]|uniref:DUF4935 domain-containing protein n=1 Tax=Thermomonospora cellulosilytica TaxID=1411118 RepID=A0A7W3RA23_9ACTN|nr:PIN domain-containing protein [Thermomonospora cellulosilytica]MBA9005953.1 hypothetical protein [Thermomonospora cellulosilytica]